MFSLYYMNGPFWNNRYTETETATPAENKQTHEYDVCGARLVVAFFPEDIIYAWGAGF